MIFSSILLLLATDTNIFFHEIFIAVTIVKVTTAIPTIIQKKIATISTILSFQLSQITPTFRRLFRQFH